MTTTPTGFRVEAALPRALMNELGFPLAAGTTLRAGLFRADFTGDAPDVASFGTLRFAPAQAVER